MSTPQTVTGLAGTRRGYDTCPGCGHARVKHLSAPRGGCVAATWWGRTMTGEIAGNAGGLCTCPAANNFPEGRH